jgi:hypothetical protein
LPRGLSEVRVIRKRGGPPSGPRDGERIPAAHDHLVDRNLNNNEIFHYGIYAIYAMGDGKLFPSPGVVFSARPHPPVSPLEAPRLFMEPGGRVRMDWIEPARGTVKIIRTTRPLLLPAGSRLSQVEAATLEGSWIEPFAPDRAYDPEPPAEGHCYYTPLTAWSGTLTVGNMVALSRAADPSELRATRAGSGLGSGSGGTRVTLRWRWTNDSSAAMVVARQGTAPLGPQDPSAITATVDRSDYDRSDCWTFSLPPSPCFPPVDGTAPFIQTGASSQAEPSPKDASPWHIRVYSIITADGVRSVSPGMEPTAATILPGPNPEVTVSYVLKRPWLPGLPWWVKFRTEPAGMSVPPMVLIANPRAVPLSVDDGQIVAHFPAGSDGARFPIRPTVNLSLHGGRIFIDPHVEPDALTPIRLRHPETGVTRL